VWRFRIPRCCAGASAQVAQTFCNPELEHIAETRRSSRTFVASFREAEKSAVPFISAQAKRLTLPGAVIRSGAVSGKKFKEANHG
jgi:hypothetical protein